MRKLILLILFLLAGVLFAQDFNTGFFLGNRYFAKDRPSTALEHDSSDFRWGIDANFQRQFNDKFFFDSGFVSNPTLHGYGYGKLRYEEIFFAMEFGPIFGIFHNFNQPLKPGLTASVKLGLPRDILFFRIFGTSTLGSRLIDQGDYQLTESGANLGFRVKNAICQFNFIFDQYMIRDNGEDPFKLFKQISELTLTGTESNLEIAEKMMEISFQMNIYKKNIPYQIGFITGYQTLSRNYFPDAGDNITHQLSSVIIGMSLKLLFGEIVTLEADFKANATSYSDSVVYDPNALLFETGGHIKLDLQKIGQHIKMRQKYKKELERRRMQLEEKKKAAAEGQAGEQDSSEKVKEKSK